MLLLAVAVAGAASGAHARPWVTKRVTEFGTTYSGSTVTVTVGNGVFNVMDHGAKGDGQTNDTIAIQAAFQSAAKSGSGGTVLFPNSCSGGCNFMTAAFTFLSSNTALEVQGGATVTILNDRAKWPAPLDIINCANPGGNGLNNLALVGSGQFNGQGQVWWANRFDFRPRFFHCHADTVLVSDLTFNNCPNHNLEMYTNNSEVVNVKINAPPSHGVPTNQESHNTDAIDVHGSPFLIHQCDFSVGDDNVAVHASNVLVQNCHFGTGHGASIGSLAGNIGNMRNITFRDITFTHTTNGMRIKSHPSASGTLHDVYYENLTMHDVQNTVIINMNYGDTSTSTSMSAAGDDDGGTLQIRNIYYRNITVMGTQNPGQLDCLSSSPCHSLEMTDFQQHKVQGQWECQNAHGTANNVNPKPCF